MPQPRAKFDSVPRVSEIAQLAADIEALHALVAAARAERDAAIAERDHALSQIDRLRHLLRQLQRAQFGRRSEKLDPEQLLLALEDIEQAIHAGGRGRRKAASSTVHADSRSPSPCGRSKSISHCLGFDRDAGRAARPRVIIEGRQRAFGHCTLNAALDSWVIQSQCLAHCKKTRDLPDRPAISAPARASAGR